RDARFARAILEAVPGLEVVGAPGGGEWGHDCGARQVGIIGKDAHARLVEGMFESARSAGADAVAALYHSCYRQFCGRETDQGMEVVHYTALVGEALGLPPVEEAFKKLKLEASPDKAGDRLKDRAAARGVTEKRLRATLGAHFSK